MSAGGGVACQRAVAMSSDAVAARKGRLKQRYDNEFRLVAGSAPSRSLPLDFFALAWIGALHLHACRRLVSCSVRHRRRLLNH
jgi:hypothetical protein